MGADIRPLAFVQQGPGDQAVEEVHAILRQIVGMVLNSPECSMLQRYIVLKREIATVAAASLEKVQNSHLSMSWRMVERQLSGSASPRCSRLYLALTICLQKAVL